MRDEAARGEGGDGWVDFSVSGCGGMRKRSRDAGKVGAGRGRERSRGEWLRRTADRLCNFVHRRQCRCPARVGRRRHGWPCKNKAIVRVVVHSCAFLCSRAFVHFVQPCAYLCIRTDFRGRVKLNSAPSAGAGGGPCFWAGCKKILRITANYKEILMICREFEYGKRLLSFKGNARAGKIVSGGNVSG